MNTTFWAEARLDIYQITVQQTTYIYNLHILIDKQVNQNKVKIYLCFVDFKKAFDSIWQKDIFFIN